MLLSSARSSLRRMILIVVALFAFCRLVPLAAAAASESEGSKKCERLQDTLTYTQEQAPRDLSSVLPVVVEKINRVLDGVVDVEVEWTGAELHGRVGEHIIETTVTRLTGSNNSIPNSGDVRVDEFGREVTSRCFHVPFTILDTDECLLPPNHPMRHVCPPSSICINTDGSYDCSCPRLFKINDSSDTNPWEVSFSSSAKSSCPSMPSTQGCCTASAHSTEGKRCRKRFQCPIDPCADHTAHGDAKKIHDCVPSATCIRAESPNAINHDSQKQESSSSSVQLYTCQCPEGLMGNGKTCRPGIDAPPQPMVMFDGVTPTALTIKSNFYCGCTKPKVDACSGFPPCQGKHEFCTVSASTDNKPICACRPGYVHHNEYGCVDVNPPTLKLRNDPRGEQILRLKQGDEYREHMVDIVDDNAEDYLRSLKVTYSQPLPPGCLTGVGEFHVNYTVAMPWTNPPYVRITRRVIIEDINECSILPNSKALKKFQRTCPQLIPQCDMEAGAECRNIVGSYSCQCPVRTNGDGFLPSAKFDDDDNAYPKPSSFKGGTSCVDTSKPVITVQGPNPKIFRVSECGGLSGVMSPYSRSNHNEDEKEKLIENQRGLYETDIKEMIRATAGAELCATHENPRVKSSDCIEAIDQTYKGKVDLSDRVMVGDPIQKSRLHWVVPYDVKDDAGNEATTVHRDIMVEEVGLAGLEKRIRGEVADEEQRKTKRAIDNAIKEARKKWETESRAPTNSRSSRNNSEPNSKSCPACSPCVCPETDAINAGSCSGHCSNMSETCRKLSDDNYLYNFFFFVEDIFPPYIVLMFVMSFLVAGLLYLMQWAVHIFNPRSYTNYDYGNYNSINDDMVLATTPEVRQVVPTQTHNGTNNLPSQIPPTASFSSSNAQNRNNGAFFSPGSQSLTGYDGEYTRNTSESSGMGSLPPYEERASQNRYAQNNDLVSPHTPSSIRRDTYEGSSVYLSPPLIVPSKNGEGARRRSPYR